MAEHQLSFSRTEINEEEEKVTLEITSSDAGAFTLLVELAIFSQPEPLSKEIELDLLAGQNIVEVSIPGMGTADYIDASIYLLIYSEYYSPRGKIFASGSIKRRRS